MRPEPTDSEDVIADLELADGAADCFDLSGQLHAEDPPPRPTEPDEGADEERFRTPPAAVGPGDGGGVDLHEHFVVLRNRPLDVLDSKNLRRPVLVVDNRSHAGSGQRLQPHDDRRPPAESTTSLA